MEKLLLIIQPHRDYRIIQPGVLPKIIQGISGLELLEEQANLMENHLKIILLLTGWHQTQF